jgi:phosphohistidine swiveling domain-containing protein
MHPSIRRIETLVPKKAAAYGGKARSLATLARAGFPVPAAFAISSEVLDALLKNALGPDELPERVLVAPAREITAERLATIREKVRHAPLPPGVQDAVRRLFVTLKEEGAEAVAVRSSALREDEDARSAAGLYESVLGVSDEAALEGALRHVWSSLYDLRVVSYLRALGVTTRAGLGVIVQALVPADAAGVLFTVNPLSGDSGEIVLNAAYGLGGPVVDGSVSPDTIRIDKASGFVRDRVRGDKARALRFRVGTSDDPRGTFEEEVSAEDAARFVLSDREIATLVDVGVRIEAHFGDARDIEWARVGSAFYVLQARPVTALKQPPVKAGARRVAADRAHYVWSNLNVGEALPGVATPFTWSILSGFSELGFRRAFGALGCSVPRDAELVGSFRGRIYLNLTEFMSIASQVPGLRAKTLLSLGGGDEAERLQIDMARQSSSGFYARLPMTTARYFRENFRLTERVLAFERTFLDDAARIDSIDFRLLSATALDRTLVDVERLLDASGQVLLNVYGNLLASVVTLRVLIAVALRKDDADRHTPDTAMRELLTGLIDVDSAGPGIALFRVAEVARGDAAALAMLTSREPRDLRTADLPAGPTRMVLEEFFAQYGDRGAREAEIAEPRWGEDPTLPFATIRMHLTRSGRGPTPIQVVERQREIRERAQEAIEKRVPFFARPPLRRLLALVQHFVRMRERLRGHVVKVLGLFRSVGLDASRRMLAMEPGCGPDGAFFLSIDELHAVLRGEAHGVASLIKSRRVQFERDRAMPDPPDTFVGFPPLETELGPTDELHGVSASGGRAIGRARVLGSAHDSADLRAGEILVSHHADVGWSPLFLAAGALVTDLGGALSHASVVAREFALPAVVNVKTGTRVIRTGDLLEVDGDTGLVRILERSRV